MLVVEIVRLGVETVVQAAGNVAEPAAGNVAEPAADFAVEQVVVVEVVVDNRTLLVVVA